METVGDLQIHLEFYRNFIDISVLKLIHLADSPETISL